MAGRFKTWFLRNVLESAEREYGATALDSVSQRITPRLRPHLMLERLRTSAALDTLPLDEAEEVLLALDAMLGDGSGRALERIAEDLYAKTLIQGGGAVRLKDLFGTMARLRGLLEHPFEEVTILFDLARTEGGLSLGLSVVGQPRATKVLRHLAAGAIRAAERFARESALDSLKLHGELVADRAQLIAQYRSVSMPGRERIESAGAPPPSRRLSSSPRLAALTNLSAEVDRILDPSLAAAERRRGSMPPPRITPPPSPPTSTRLPIGSSRAPAASDGDAQASPSPGKRSSGESNQG